MNMNSLFYSIKLAYYCTPFLCKAMVNGSGLTMCMLTHTCVHQTMVAKINQTIIFLPVNAITPFCNT